MCIIAGLTGVIALGGLSIQQGLSTDPGRALITGNPEAFDMPALHGIAKTAPYFHDNAFIQPPGLKLCTHDAPP